MFSATESATAMWSDLTPYKSAALTMNARRSCGWCGRRALVAGHNWPTRNAATAADSANETGRIHVSCWIESM